MEIMAYKPTVEIWICDFQIGGLTHLKMALILIRRMVPNEVIGNKRSWERTARGGLE